MLVFIHNITVYELEQVGQYTLLECVTQKQKKMKYSKSWMFKLKNKSQTRQLLREMFSLGDSHDDDEDKHVLDSRLELFRDNIQLGSGFSSSAVNCVICLWMWRIYTEEEYIMVQAIIQRLLSTSLGQPTHFKENKLQELYLWISIVNTEAISAQVYLSLQSITWLGFLKLMSLFDEAFIAETDTSLATLQ